MTTYDAKDPDTSFLPIVATAADGCAERLGDPADHLISPEERYRVAVALQ